LQLPELANKWPVLVKTAVRVATDLDENDIYLGRGPKRHPRLERTRHRRLN